jgi:hypothetical protein
MIRSRTRTGATLTEVLVAIFVMAIGLLALLTLFPLGALSMAQAIKDGRTAQSSKSAFAIAEAMNIHNDPVVISNGLAPAVPGFSPTYFLNAYPTITPAGGALLAPDLQAIGNWDNAGYPIYVDPIGCRSFQSLGLAVGLPYPTVGNVLPPVVAPNAGATPFSSIPRQPLNSLLPAPGVASILIANASTQSLVRWCTLSDDITFQENGTPSTNTGAVQRENRYTWAWLLRRPKATDPTVVDVAVVVYSGRSLTSLGETPFPNPNLPLGPTNQFVIFDPSSKFVDIYYSGTKPSIRTGSWILDATMEYFIPASSTNVPDPHGFFYRVVGVTDVNSTTMRLELQTYPKNRTPTVVPGTAIPYGVLIVMENVVEVFEKGPGWQP